MNSHWHGDHVRGNQAFADAEIVATARTKELIETRAAEQLADQKATDFDALLSSLPDATQPFGVGLYAGAGVAGRVIPVNTAIPTANQSSPARRIPIVLKASSGPPKLHTQQR